MFDTSKVNPDSSVAYTKFQRLLQIGVYCWAIRLAFAAFGMIFGSVFEFMSPDGGGRVRVTRLTAKSWKSVVISDFSSIQTMREKMDPVLFSGLDIISESLLRTVMTKSLSIESFNVKVSNESMFTHFQMDLPWSDRYRAEHLRYNYLSMSEYLQLPATQFAPYSVIDGMRPISNTHPAASGGGKGGKRRSRTSGDGPYLAARPSSVGGSSSSYSDSTRLSSDRNDPSRNGQPDKGYSSALDQWAICTDLSAAASATQSSDTRPSCSDPAVGQLTNQDQEQQPLYMYATLANINALVPSLSPGLSQFMGVYTTLPVSAPHSSSGSDRGGGDIHIGSHHGSQEVPQMCLWLSSPDITAALHYDLEDNFLLQVSGTKTVTVVSPEAVRLLGAYPSLHPLWRQTQLSSHLRTAKHIADLFSTAIRGGVLPEEATAVARMHLNGSLHYKGTTGSADDGSDGTTTSGCTGDAVEDETGDEINGYPVDGFEAAFDQRIEAACRREAERLQRTPSPTCRQKQLRGKHPFEVQVWEVQLRPGDMLYIPAGYLHMVTAGEDSVSLNAWFSSPLSALHAALADSVPLPFTPREKTDVKLAKLAAMVRAVLRDTDISPEKFRAHFLARYQPLLTARPTVGEGSEQSSGSDPAKSTRKSWGGGIATILGRSMLAATAEEQVHCKAVWTEGNSWKWVLSQNGFCLWDYLCFLCT